MKGSNAESVSERHEGMKSEKTNPIFDTELLENVLKPEG